MADLQVEYPREITRELHDYEFLLSFNSDETAVDFDEWWAFHGKAAFEKWLASRNE